MINSLYIAATGMVAQQQNVEAIANNLANVNTTGFKKNRISFEDAYSRVARNEMSLSPSSVSSPIIFGMGTLVSSNTKSFTSGEIKPTEGMLDLAIHGNGLFEVQLADGSSAYTRHGALRVTQDGLLGTESGFALKQQIQIPIEATDVVIDNTGMVFAQLSGEKELVELGQIELTTFQNYGGLEPVGENLFVASKQVGETQTAIPGENGVGYVMQGYLESSNVQLADEMVNLVLAQRAYELNAKVISTTDEMLSISNNLRR